MRKPIYLPAPPSEIVLDWHPDELAAQAQLTALRHREAQIAASIGIVLGALVTWVLASSGLLP